MNGSSNWGVSFARISWLYGVLSSHQNIATLARHDEVVFELTRRRPADRLRLLYYDLPSMGLDGVLRARAAFAPLHILFIGPSRNRYTEEAKRYCLDAHIGLYNSTEINGALWRDEYWAFHNVDSAGAPVYRFARG